MLCERHARMACCLGLSGAEGERGTNEGMKSAGVGRGWVRLEATCTRARLAVFVCAPPCLLVAVI